MIKQYHVWSLRIQNYFSSIFLILMTIAVFLQVIARKLIPFPLPWTSEIAKLSLIWLTYIGLGATFKQSYHIRIDLIDSIIKTNKQKNIMNLFVNLIGIVFGGFIIYYSYTYLVVQFTFGQSLSVISLPMWIALVPLLLGGVLTTIHFIIAFISGIQEMGKDK